MSDETTTGGDADNRRERRQRVLKSGRIVFNGGYTAYDCRVKNVSSGGALLQMPSLLGIPNQFEIDIDKSNKLRPCTVMWRNDTMMGVRFDDVPQPAADAPAADATGDGRPQLRLVENEPSETDEGGAASSAAAPRSA